MRFTIQRFIELIILCVFGGLVFSLFFYFFLSELNHIFFYWFLSINFVSYDGTKSLTNREFILFKREGDNDGFRI